MRRENPTGTRAPKTPGGQPRTTNTIKLPAGLWARLQDHAYASGISANQQVTALISEWVRAKDHEK